MAKETFDFSAGLRKKLLIAFVAGAVLLLVGAMFPGGEHSEEHAEGHHNEHYDHDGHSEGHDEESHDEGHGPSYDEVELLASGSGDEGHDEGGHGGGWLKRFKVDFWINNIYFTGIALIGLFFFAIQYAAQAGWSAYILRIPLSIAHWILPSAILMIGAFLVFNRDIFHSTYVIVQSIQ